MSKPLKLFTRRMIRRVKGRNRQNAAKPSVWTILAQRYNWTKAALLVGTIALLSGIMSMHLMPDHISLRPGERAPRDIYAPRSVTIINTAATQRLQQAARLETPSVYDTNVTAPPAAHRAVGDVFASLERLRGLPLRPRGAPTSPQVMAPLNAEQTQRLLACSPDTFNRLRDNAIRLIDDAMSRPIRDKPDDLPHARREMQLSVQDALPIPADAAPVQAIVTAALAPDTRYNPAKTEHEREEEARRVSPIREHIARGDKIIAANEVVTPEHVERFTALGLVNPRPQLPTAVAICVLAAGMVMFVAFYIARALPEMYESNNKLALLAVISLMGVFGLKVGGAMLGLSFSSGQLGYLGMMSVAAAGMLVAVMLDTHLAVLIAALLAVQSGLIMNNEIRFTVMTLISGLIGIVSVGTLGKRHNLVGATAALAAANLSLVWLLGLLMDESVSEMLTGSAWACASAVFAVFLFWFGIQVLERPFGVVTHSALLELCAFDRPLIKQLCAAAPGTYAHCMMVGTLAESGAQAIGADALLCRVGGYYHDIGKIKRPEFFVENQRHENVHGRLSPSLSGLIIAAHVRDGVEMAEKARLPRVIRDIVEQHHGTTLIRYFYHQALAGWGENEEVPPGLEERFRYPGPRPQTREAAVVMLADTVEAAARCLQKPTEERLRTVINDLVREKIDDGQLDECPITFRDVHVISEAFVHVVMAMMHGRIDYPSASESTVISGSHEIPSNSVEAAVSLLSNTAATLPYYPAGEMLLPQLGAHDAADADLRALSEEIPRHLEANGGASNLAADSGPPAGLSPEETYEYYAAQPSVAETENSTAPTLGGPPSAGGRPPRGRRERPADR